ncbi:hypothetical protein LN650_21245 [Klebsiella pneumoniae subsp. pneumoniae]|nr:hypothetical protein [Klebsiella pneumoniae subsp. pneumoniae]
MALPQRASPESRLPALRVLALATTWDAPRQRPTACMLLVALFMLLRQPVPFYLYRKVGGISSE